MSHNRFNFWTRPVNFMRCSKAGQLNSNPTYYVESLTEQLCSHPTCLLEFLEDPCLVGQVQSLKTAASPLTLCKLTLCEKTTWL